MTFAVTYSLHPQQVSECAFTDSKEGIQQALKFVKRMERLGYKCEPTQMVLTHRLNTLKR